jgi:hypothetical protein
VRQLKEGNPCFSNDEVLHHDRHMIHPESDSSPVESTSPLPLEEEQETLSETASDVLRCVDSWCPWWHMTLQYSVWV